MALEPTQRQSDKQQQVAQTMSLQRTRPPTQVSGYEAKQFIGSGAYGEVWSGIDRNTGRKVAIKFYTHHGGLDWSLLSREVEKLVFLSADRHVVQLLDVGWEAAPPYYVMEYIENGSLEDLLRQLGPLPMPDAVEMFNELAVGLMHAHGKGVLHCDLKPANVLLDQDNKPRLADFGQSRLTTEQMPALGTLYYMAPEQADLDAVPDARWDVYALGALLYCMLTGAPPHYSDQATSDVESETNLNQRLDRYREIIRMAPPPSEHRRVPGIDRAMVDIIDHCLAVDPADRFDTVQRIVDALHQRANSRAFRPLLILGFLGPVLLSLVMALFAWRGFNRAVHDADQALSSQALKSNLWIAKRVAGTVSYELDRYYRAVEDVYGDADFRQSIAEVLADQQLVNMLSALDDPKLDTDEEAFGSMCLAVENHSARLAIKRFLDELITQQPKVASWFVTDRNGTFIAIAFDREVGISPVGKNYSWRTYFHGGPDDLERNERPSTHIERTHLSATFKSQATFTDKVAISTPIYLHDEFVGILAMTLEIGRFFEIEGSDPENQFAVLVDARDGKNKGVVLQHPLFDKIFQEEGQLPSHLNEHRVQLDQWRAGQDLIPAYKDPIGMAVDQGRSYRKEWIAAKAPVQLRPRQADLDQDSAIETGLLVIVQEDKAASTKPVHVLSVRLVRELLTAFGVLVVVVSGLWFLVRRGAMRGTRHVLQLPTAESSVPHVAEKDGYDTD